MMNKKTLKEMIESDKFRIYGKNKVPLFFFLHEPSLHFIILQRKTHYHFINHHYLSFFFSNLKMVRMSRKYHFQIPYTVSFGPGLTICHYGRVIIAPNVQIGGNASIFTGVTIGSTLRGKHMGIPTIGNDVWIGPNAVIVGKINIGDDVLIAGGGICQL